MKLRIHFIITGLAAHGAEIMLCKLLSRIDRDLFDPEVISLMDMGDLGEGLQNNGISVKYLNMRRSTPDPVKFCRLARIIREFNPDLVQTWMYHSDLLGGLAAKLVGKMPVVWNIRNSNLEPGSSKSTTIMTVKACARLSRYLPDKIICCAETARTLHESLGYDPRKMVFIPNGFDTTEFKPNKQARYDIREELGISREAVIIGMVARFDPQKDIMTFIKAARVISDKRPGIQFILCGDDMSSDNKTLSAWINECGLQSTIHLVGHRKDVPRMTAAFDIATLSSAYGEAFSNSIGEAMACGIPCVATDVGDARHIVADTGKIVSIRQPEALATAWEEMLAPGMETLQALGERARERVITSFSLEHVVRQYENIYKNLLPSADVIARDRIRTAGRIHP
jgi:glycosyltransferase involved in cell wall biosynthesis